MGGSSWRTLWRVRGRSGAAHVAMEAGPAPTGRDRGGGYRVAQIGEWGGMHGPHVENVGQPGEKGNGPGPGNRGIFDLFK
jgi:hypothetical protein